MRSDCGPVAKKEFRPEPAETIYENPSWSKQPVTVSGVLIAYNQEAFVHQALASALNQTYPIDLIVSDDCSTDRTGLVMRATLGGYRGRHRVRVRYGLRNLGVCGNQNAAIRLAEGELIVLFEGDDESVPERVEKLVQAYLRHNRRVAALGSAIQLIDRQGSFGSVVSWPLQTGDAWTSLRGQWAVHGCGLAFRRDCFFDVGPISRRLISGDIALWLRAAFAKKGGMAQVREPLVYYRVHGANVSKGFTLDFWSPEILRTCCRNLLKNEVAQVLELRKIARYRRREDLQNDEFQAAWKAHFRVAEARARLVLAISRRSRLRWIWPAVVASRFPQLRGKALRTIALAICPSARAVYKRIRHHSSLTRKSCSEAAKA